MCGGGARAHAPQSAARKGMSRLFQRPASATQPSRRGAGQSPSARPSRAVAGGTVHSTFRFFFDGAHPAPPTPPGIMSDAGLTTSHCEAGGFAVRGGKGRSARRASSQCEAEEVAVRGRRGRSARRPGGRSAHGSSARGAKRAFRASQSLLFACARLSDESAHPCARDTPSPKAAGPHRPDRGLRGWPSGVLSPRHQRANVGRRGTWPLPGAAPAMVLSFSQRWRQ